MGLCAQNLVHVRCSPSVSEISTQVRPCQASMHPTKSPPPSHPQQPLSRPPSPPAPQGRRGACQEVMSTGSSRRCSHWEALWQPPSLTHSNLRCSASSAGLCQGASTGLFPNVRSHWHPGFTRKHLLALRAAPFLEGTSCYPKPPNPQGAAAFLLPICSLLSGKKNTNQGPVPLGVALLIDCKIPRHLGFAPILPVQRTRETFALTPLTRLRKFTAPGVGFLCCFLTVCSFNPLLLGPHSPSSP